MEGVREPGAGAEELPGVRGVERSEGCPAAREQRRPITGDPGKWTVAQRESEGVVVVIERRDNITRRERRAPASSMHFRCQGGDPGECRFG